MTAHAFAAEPLEYTETLHFTWAGIGLGDLTITMQQKGNHYKMSAQGRTSGLVALFNSHRSVTKVGGMIHPRKNNIYIPATYRSDYVDNSERRLIAVEYDAEGFPATETIVPPREEIRPLVPPEMKRGAVDILTGFFVMRERLRQALILQHTPVEQGETTGTSPPSFSVTIYDGKRLFRVDAKLQEASTNVKFYANGVTRPAVKLALQRVPLAGYKDKEMKKLKKRNPVISLYVEPERLVPFGVTVPVYGAKLEGWSKQ